jgi:filamentous hemagglutinin family protein
MIKSEVRSLLILNLVITPSLISERPLTNADIILNEVGSTNRSVLEGALEVFGKNAAVVIANPNGFYCFKLDYLIFFYINVKLSCKFPIIVLTVVFLSQLSLQ